jgi:hypothetical protein
MRVWCDVSHAIARLQAQLLERGRPLITASEELVVGKSQIAINNRFSLGIELARPAREL